MEVPMSTAVTQNNQVTVSWDPEPVKASMKNATDAFIDAIEPHATTLAKSAAVAST